MRFSNILLVLDTDFCRTPALDRAVALVRNERAALTLCSVVDSIPANDLRTITAITPAEMLDSVVTATRNRLTTLADELRARGIPTKLQVLVGKAHTEIARLVRSSNCDLVIKPIAEHGTIRARVERRENTNLMRHCPCPVWLVSAENPDSESAIIAALDMPDEADTNSELNENILRVARSIALAEFRPLHVVHVWRLFGEGHLRARGDARANRAVDQMVEREAAKRAIWLRETVSFARSESERLAIEFVAPKLHVVKGLVRQVVPELAEKLNAGLIVMGTAGRTGLSGLVRGNTSEAILARSDCSFLIVKQPDTTLESESDHSRVEEAQRSTRTVRKPLSPVIEATF